MGQVIERAWARRKVKFNNATVSDPIDLRGFQEFFLEIGGGLSGQTINIESEGDDGVWSTVLDITGATVVVPATSDGWVFLPELPTFGKIRFTSGAAITAEQYLDCKS